jgi:hypothetical protein
LAPLPDSTLIGGKVVLACGCAPTGCALALEPIVANVAATIHWHDDANKARFNTSGETVIRDIKMAFLNTQKARSLQRRDIAHHTKRASLDVL